MFFIIFICFKKNKEGFITQKQDIAIYTDNDIFDDFYSKLYDKLLLDEPKLNFEINYIFQNQNQDQNKLKTYNVLDIGLWNRTSY